jgi:hypothetical protein
VLAVDVAPRRAPRKPLIGKPTPRIAPTLPAIGRLRDYLDAAARLGLKPYPWQTTAARYLTATNRELLWRFRDFIAVVSRQNGKTEFLLPRIVMELEDGGRTLHTAQDRALPRLTFEHLADLINDEPSLRQQVQRIRTANGTESIVFKNGGRYILLAPGHGVRGHHGDLVLEDEVREQRDYRLQRAMGPTTLASRNPQRVKLSNAGDEDSVVLNDLRARMDEGGSFCYLEWSASPERGIDDREGWAQANPALGHGFLTMAMLEDARRTQTPAGFETEHLCRWVVSMATRLVNEAAWTNCRGPVESSIRPVMAINMDGSGTRASAVTAWQQTDGVIAIRLEADVTGAPIAVEALGPDLAKRAIKLGVSRVGMDDWTDRALGSYFRNIVAINGREYANASINFVRAVDGGVLRWAEGDVFAEDLAWTSRKPHESGAWQAVKANEERPITSVLAAIRAVWLASGPRPAAPRVL